MRLEGLMKSLRESSDFKDILSNIENKKVPAGVFGLSDSSRAYVIGGLFQELDKPFVVFAQNDIDARNIFEDLSLYTTSVYFLPSREVVFYNIEAISGDLRWERLKVIRKILSPGKKIIVTSIEALASTYVPVDLYREYTFKIKEGGTLLLNELNVKLIQSGYNRVDLVEGRGEFSLRGGILDVFPPTSPDPYRIELFGDEVDSIRSFNTESQRSIERIKSIEIFPAKEIILKKENIEKGYNAIEREMQAAAEKLKKGKKKEASERLKEITNSNLESLKENWDFETIESFLPYFYEKPATLFEYLQDYTIVIDDPQRCKGRLDSLFFEFEDDYLSFLERGNILPGQNKLLVDKDFIFQDLEGREVITLDAIAKTARVLEPKSIVSFSQLSLQNYQGRIELLIQDIKENNSKGFKTVILSGTRPRGERLVSTLADYGITSSYKDIFDDIMPGEVLITFGSQLKGFEFPELKISVISDKEVFGEAKRKSARKFAKKGAGKIKSFTELKPGDYVVHLNHGIGVYKGIKQLELQGFKKDYLELSYAGNDTLYVPVEQLDMVQKFIGSEGKSPKINKLGNSEWSKAKSKARKSIEEVAEDLVKLYAVRSSVKGFRFTEDTVWQKQFEDEFPYDETEDQLSAIEDIKKDMESEKVMDRLLCGDVGYGKTEVAMRAAFKAVMDSKQVAVLVPTTILAQQHYQNFVQRFSDFPVKIGLMSRFRTPTQHKDTLKALKRGEVDILIGTHRILQKDVGFKDLGLLVVDEEQRFGVTHKEKIKGLKKNVDVLTLSATPIPRTLHMSLVGVRDISVIETPPKERLPVQTYVVEYNDQLIRDAILREMHRGGQVYFVHNRVETILETSNYLSKLVPEARIAIGHGQMNERELEEVIVDFMAKEYDVLVSTTIIETGMDIKNVNTMIINDADKMGLSQLYQLRGRVGRTNKMAYCYLTYRKDKILTEVAEKRLKAIKDFTELGSGFKIALKDLEIRGAGNIMGSSQHGHMASVGYDLYCRMLEDTIKLIKGEIDKEPVETTVDIRIDAYIPESYIEDEVQKIEVYKKIASISSFDDMMDMTEELVDRFSDIPASVINLMEIAYVRSIGKNLGIEEIKETGDEVMLKFESSDSLDENLVKSVIDKYSKQIVFRYGEKPAIACKLKEIKHGDIIEFLMEFLKFMNENKPAKHVKIREENGIEKN
jgi:transcription-repair coupling factor (superfamily II helicase)